MSMSNKRNSGTLVAGAILIALGLLSLFGQLFQGYSFWSYLWPIMIIGIGGMFFIGMFAGGKSAAGLAIPGSIISCIGLMMFFQNLANHWESWAYGWTIILFSVGLGIFIMGAYTEDVQRRQSGLRVMKTGAILFIIFGGVFEGLIFSAFRGNGIQPYIFPALLILLGVYLVLVRSGLLSSRRSEPTDQPTNLSEENK
jgi:hypothetical protein